MFFFWAEINVVGPLLETFYAVSAQSLLDFFRAASSNHIEALKA